MLNLRAKLKSWADNTPERMSWVVGQLKKLPPGKILDVGAGTQVFRPFCSHLQYFAQDFGESSEGLGRESREFAYGPIDYRSNCWNISEKDGTFDYALCTEVLEHVPYPLETIKEIHRLLKPGGYFILTVPSHSARHMDPHWFLPGFSDNYLKKFFPELGFKIIEIRPTGNYFDWMLAQLIQTAALDRISAAILMPAIFYFRWRSRKPPKKFDGLLTGGYFVLAQKK